MRQAAAKKHLAVIAAFANGASVQYRNSPSSKWYDTTDPEFNSSCDYRIKLDTIKSRRYVYEAPVYGQRVGVIYEGAIREVHWPSSNLPDDEANIKRIENMSSFIGWIDNDWVESEIPARQG